MSHTRLDDLFRGSPPGEIPDGYGTGSIIAFAGSGLERPVLHLSRWLVWQGTMFDRARARLRHRIGPFGLLAQRASVYIAPSWLDREPAIILDYSRSLIGSNVRDEIREVNPGTYLGIVFYSGKKVAVNFVIQVAPHEPLHLDA